MKLVGDRCVADSRSWVLPLDTHNIPRPTYPDHLLDFASFSVNLAEKSYSNYEIQVQRVKSPSLKYEYVLADATNIRNRFRDLTIMALHLLKDEHRPVGMDSIFVRFPGTGPRYSEPRMDWLEGWVPPENSGWEYRDDEMFEILKAKHPELAEELDAMQHGGTKRKREDDDDAKNAKVGRVAI